MSNAIWHVYLLSCKDGTLYCGVAKDVQKRLALHNAGKGAKFTRGRAPCHLVWQSNEPLIHGDALRLERTIKKMSREEKQSLIAQNSAL